MIQISSPGGYDKLEYKPLSATKYTTGANVKLDSVSEEDLVTVQTCAAGVNYADVCVRWGVYESAKQYVGWPITPGFEFSGKIIAKGGNVSEFEHGESVFGLTMFGGYSEVIKVPKNQIFPMPKNLNLKQAAGFPTVAITAWYAMFELARPRPGSWILIHSAAGGVGSMLVQMAKIAKCNVVGVVGASHKVKVVKETLAITAWYAMFELPQPRPASWILVHFAGGGAPLSKMVSHIRDGTFNGCDYVIDKSNDDLWSCAKRFSPVGYHAVFDANGVATLNDSYNHLAPMGRLIVYGFHTMLPRSSETSSGAIQWWQWLKIAWNYFWTPRFNPLKMTSSNKSIMAFNLSFLFGQTEILTEAMQQLLSWVENGSLRVCQVQEYPLKDAGKAHSDLESGKTIGKLVLTSEQFELQHSSEN